MWKGNVARTVNAVWVLSAVMIVPVLSAVVALAAPGSLRTESYRYYVQGHQQGRSDAMAKQNLHQLPDASFLQDEFRREYRRGYRDGYQLIMR